MPRGPRRHAPPPPGLANHRRLRRAAWWLLLPALLLGGGGPAAAMSELLEQVKRNPAMARSYCARFAQLNAEGQSATSRGAIAEVASRQGLSAVDAEILVTYIIGMYCPDIR